ncbi:MAG TPA: malectin domain-containing carbohydrate-binding protein [Terriglobia bacterium]|nr:malectin domain-containing carbohydrate-binding protein [Terriglobia bacterium]
MSEASKHQAEKSELEAVLSSDTFVKSPSLARLLSYICNKYFEGCSADSKEYNIGVEAMGKQPDFDPAMNSVVRVEVHRLRQKLKKYYETEGTQHTLEITLPVGHYVPQFIRRDPVIPLAPEVDAVSKISEEEYSVPPSGTSDRLAPLINQPVAQLPNGLSRVAAIPKKWNIRPGVLLAVVIGAVTLILGVLMLMKPGEPTSANFGADSGHMAEKASLTPVTNGQPSVRIIAGYSKNEYVDHSGKVWEGDRYFTGGTVASEPERFIFRTLDPTLYQSYRSGNFSYDIPLKPGDYELRLRFAELFFGPESYRGGGESNRIFSIDLNGKRLVQDLDVICDAGGSNIAYVRDFKNVSPGPDGYLHLKFVPYRDEPMLSALEILPSNPGKTHPIRIIARDNPYTDHEGRTWSADCYFLGGQLAHHKAVCVGTLDPGLYSSQRFGNFSYSLPVAPGKYRLTLRFSETYFGLGNPGGGGAGSRIFDVLANGHRLLHNFDIFKEAGGEDRALDKTFSGLTPNAQGQIVLDFVPVVNYACVSGIELTEESK